MTNRYEELNQAFHRTDAENAAHYVYHEIQALKEDRGNVQMRWVWELLQNAHDARNPNGDRLIDAIEYCSEKLAFLHNGRGFKADEIAHLIKSGTTKDEADTGTHGKFGRGFLTTHLLSPRVNVSGPLDDGTWFNFTLMRNDESKPALTESLWQSQKAFMNSISPNKPSSIPDQFTTQFVYPICEAGAEKAVWAGIEALRQCVPYLVVFNKEFSSIDIRTPDETWYFKTVDDQTLDASGIRQITIVESRNENEKQMKYLLAKSEMETSVAVPIQSSSDSLICLPVENTPRLFSALPLVGTDSFSFPAVNNSSNFSSTPDRDVVIFVGEEVSNINNRDIIEEGCSLLVHLIEYAASKGWQYIHRWTKIPPIQQNLNWVNPEWLKNCIEGKFIKEIQHVPVILNQTGNAIPLNEAMLPIVEGNENLKVLVETLWDLLNDWQEYHEKLPRRDEATGWCEVIHSWTDVFGKSTSTFEKVINGRKLASYLEEKAKNSQGWGHIENLQKLLQAHVCEIEWLNRFCEFLWYNGFDSVIREHCIIPNQEGRFSKLSKLRRDSDIDESLKEIAELSGLRVKGALRDTRITSLVGETGRGDTDNEFVLGHLIKKLQEISDNDPNDKNFKETSARLFAWTVRQDQKDRKRLRDVPVFTKDGTVHSSLSSVTSKNLLPLAPIGAWDNELQQYSDLFPPECILDDRFFEVIPDPDLWQKLCEQKLIRKNMIRWYESQSNLKDYSPEVYEDDGKDHKSAETFSALGVEAWDAIMDRISNSVENSQDNAYLLWRFLTEYLIKLCNAGLEEKPAQCKFCGKEHKYYPSKWLKAIRSNRWIRDSNSGSRLPTDASSLAKLLRENDWNLGFLEDPSIIKLLSAINIPLSDLRFELITGNPEARDSLVYTMTELHQITGGDLSQVQAMVQHVQKVDGDLSQTLEVMQHMQEDENFPEYLAERQEQTRRIQENQHLGTQVENLVKENLENEGFSVNHTSIGSDFEIRLNIFRNDKNWLVEVKSTRQEGDEQSVRMTSTQVQTAVKEKDNFLLCVVPLGQENTTSDVVKEKMRFIKNISESIAPLWEDLIALKEQHANITADAFSDVVLEIEEGQAGIRVNKSVWENEGIRLEDLIKHLK